MSVSVGQGSEEHSKGAIGQELTPEQKQRRLEADSTISTLESLMRTPVALSENPDEAHKRLEAASDRYVEITGIPMNDKIGAERCRIEEKEMRLNLEERGSAVTVELFRLSGLQSELDRFEQREINTVMQYSRDGNPSPQASAPVAPSRSPFWKMPRFSKPVQQIGP